MIGPRVFLEDENQGFLGQSSSESAMSNRMAEIIDDEIKSVIERNYKISEKILKDRIDTLHAMADALMEYETLDKNQVNDIMKGKPPRPPAEDDNPQKPPSSGTMKGKGEEPPLQPAMNESHKVL